MNSRALTKIQSIILIAIIVVAAVGAAYVLLGGEQESLETIKIGICADLDQAGGKSIWQAAVLAAEQVNVEGGVLGRNLTIVAEDDDGETALDPTIATNALTRLITFDEADFIISYWNGMGYREIAADHKKILFTVFDNTEELTQGVLDNYDRYKYYFRAGVGNLTVNTDTITDSIRLCREHTGFNKIALIYTFFVQDMASSVIDTLDEYGFDVVLTESFSPNVVDFSSYFARAEAAGAEIFYPMIFREPLAIPFVKEYYDRQSPMFIWGGSILGVSKSDFWQLTEGKCEHITAVGHPVVAGYPLTSKTVPLRDAYIERWGEKIIGPAAMAYDTIRFILPDAINRAGTIETEAVIQALEETSVETSNARNFVFTPSHDIMVGKEGPNRLSDDYFFVALFQWQNGVQVPVYPIELMEEAGASYTFPDWSGPWDDLD